MRLLRLDAVTLCSVVTICFVSTGRAEDWTPAPGWYGAAAIAGHHQPGIDMAVAASANTAVAGRSGFHFRVIEDDYAAFGRLGYRLTPHLRVELEGGYRPTRLNSVEDIPAPGAMASLDLCGAGGRPGTCGKPSGSVVAWSAMANMLFDILPRRRLDPFVGAGVGVDIVRFRADGQLQGAALETIDPAIVDGGHAALAYQGLAGVTYRVTRRLDVDLTFRYLTGSNVSARLVDEATGRSAKLSGRYQDGSLALGLRYNFPAGR